jgi:pilus assembly protein FimV
LQLSDELSASGQSSTLGRELWRLEHRTLQMLNDPNDDQRALDEKLAWLEANVAELKRAGDRLAEEAAALPSPAPASVARGSVAASPPAEAAPRVWLGADPWPLYVGLTGGLLLVLLLVFRRRAAAREEQSSGPLTSSARVLGEPRLSSVEEGEKAVVAIETPAQVTIHPATARTAAPAATVPPPGSPATETELGGAAPVLELAEIMLTFGRVSGAAKTLEEYLASEPQESLRPWIRLLQIYQRNDMRDEFEAMTLKLNRNFNVEIIRWDGGETRQDLELVPLDGIEGKAMTLEEIPRIRDQIISLWGKPGCADYLEKLLRDNRDGQRRGFSLPVAEEVLFLIDLAAAREAARKDPPQP